MSPETGPGLHIEWTPSSTTDKSEWQCERGKESTMQLQFLSFQGLEMECRFKQKVQE